jgi:hypothetical protein
MEGKAVCQEEKQTYLDAWKGRTRASEAKEKKDGE